MWAILAAVVFIAVPPVVQWTGGKPAHSARRLAGYGMLTLLAAVVAAIAMRLARLGGDWTLWTVAAGIAALAGFSVAAVRRRRRAVRVEAARIYALDNLAPGRTIVRIRPSRPAPVHARPWRRIDRWLAEDGPRPTQGWWNTGALTVDDRGPALIDAAGLRHQLPAGAVALVLRPVPMALLLVDTRGAALARLPLTGFAEPELADFARAAGWRYDTVLERYHVAADFADLRGLVVDRAA
jgi:hypothetical protein